MHSSYYLVIHNSNDVHRLCVALLVTEICPFLLEADATTDPIHAAAKMKKTRHGWQIYRKFARQYVNRT